MAETKSRRPLSDNEVEISLLKGAFASNEELLKAVRNLFWGYPITKMDADLIRSAFKNDKVKEAFRKKLYPLISEDSAIGESADYWFGTETEIIGKDPETIKQIVESKHRVLELMKQGIEGLTDPLNCKIEIPFLSTKEDPFQISLLARQKYLRTIETALMIIKVIAGTKEETPEQAKARLIKDSTK